MLVAGQTPSNPTAQATTAKIIQRNGAERLIGRGKQVLGLCMNARGNCTGKGTKIYMHKPQSHQTIINTLPGFYSHRKKNLTIH